MNPNMVTTSATLCGYIITENLGVVHGLTVNTREIMSDIGAGHKILAGGQIEAYIELCELSRQEAYDSLCHKAQARGANAVVGLRYTSHEIISGITGILAYGTAVRVSKDDY